MILPDQAEGANGRNAIFFNAWRQAMNGREERRLRYAQWRKWHLSGREDGVQATYNKLAEFTDTSKAYIFAPESAQFGISLPATYGDTMIEEQEAWRDELTRWFRDSGFSETLELAVEYAHPFDSMVSKVYVDGDPATEQWVAISNIQDPSDLCVPDEKIASLDDQEIILHFYTLSVPRFLRMIAGHTDYQRLARAAMDRAIPGNRSGSSLPPAINQMIINASYPTMIGSARGGGAASMVPIARIDEPLVDMCELWVWDDKLDDYLVVTLFIPTETVIKERPNPLVPGEHPFNKLTLQPDIEYIWGQSTYDGLVKLQMWREARMGLGGDIDRLLQLQLNPPIAFFGVGGLIDEKAKNLREPGGDWSNGNPMAKVERMAPPMPPDAFAEVEQIDRMFALRCGLPQLLQGIGEAGLRAGNQAGLLAVMGAARLMRRAMRVETWLEAVLTQAMRLHRRITTDTLMKKDGTKFLMSQIPADLTARVSAHSASPLYAEELVNKAMLARDKISSEDFIELLNLPMRETLKAHARQIDANKADLMKKQLEIAMAKATKRK